MVTELQALMCEDYINLVKQGFLHRRLLLRCSGCTTKEGVAPEPYPAINIIDGVVICTTEGGISGGEGLMDSNGVEV